MRTGWHLSKLGEVYDVRDGTHDSPKYQTTGFPLITSKNLKEGELSFANVNFINELDYKKINERSRVHKGDVLFAMIGTIGNPTLVMVEPNFAIKNVALLKIPPTQSGAFLKYYLDSEAVISKMTMEAKGTTQKFVGLGYLRVFPIPLPPLSEQHRIVAILDAAFDHIATARANCEANLLNARAIFESHLQAVFTQRGDGWEVKKVSEVAKHSLGKMLDKVKNKGDFQPYLRNINVRWFAFDLSDLLQMPFLATESAKYTAIKGDVLICEGGYPGRAAIWDEHEPIYFQKALHRVRFHEPEHNKWFLYYLYSQDKSGMLKQHFSGTGIQHFTGEVLARFEIPVPPLPVLRSAVAKFDAVFEETQRLESLYQRKLQALDDLKKSLLHQAFSGTL